MIWEYDFLSMLQGLHTPVLNVIMAILSYLGDVGFLWICIGIILVIFKKTRNMGTDVLLAIVVTFIIGNLVIKNLVNRARPYEVYVSLEPLIKKPIDPSFPSGHTMNGFTAATAIFLNDRRYGILAFAGATLIAFSRMYNLVHYPTDVIAGMAVGILSAYLVHRLRMRHSQRM